jgi:hypothetical protein
VTMARTVPIDLRQAAPAASGTLASFTGRTALTLGAIAVALVLIGDKVPTFAWWTLVLVLLYLLLTNAAAAGAAVDYLTNPNS